jgi:hypothetical protein
MILRIPVTRKGVNGNACATHMRWTASEDQLGASRIVPVLLGRSRLLPRAGDFRELP